MEVMEVVVTTGAIGRAKLQSNQCVKTRDGKEPEPSNNEPTHNPSFAKNRTKAEPLSLKNPTEHKPNSYL